MRWLSSVFHGLALSVLVIIAGANTQAPDPITLDQVLTIQLAKLTQPDAMVHAQDRKPERGFASRSLWTKTRGEDGR